MTEVKRAFTERRRGPDVVVKAVWWIVGISWVLIIAALTFTDGARPQTESFFDRFFGVAVREYWNEDLLRYGFCILLFNLAVCIIGFALNMTRQRRKTDKISKSIIVLGVVTLAGILWYIFR